MCRETERIHSSTLSFTDVNLVLMIFDLFTAGSETSVNTLLWCFLYLIHFPDVQDKVHEEIDKVIGRHRSPCWRDKSEMPYTEAVINEVTRIRPVVPFGVPRLNTADIEVCGHSIPAGAWLMSNINSIHHDQTYWDRPNDFNPERFLGKAQIGGFIPFSTGLYILCAFVTY